MGTKIDISQIDAIKDAMDRYEGLPGPLVEEYIQGEGYTEITAAIRRLLPVSWRYWKKKTKGARVVGEKAVFRPVPVTLGVIVRTTAKYDYLYFPDDGSTTRRHRGNQQFMLRGAEQATPEIVETICSRLGSAFEGE